MRQGRAFTNALPCCYETDSPPAMHAGQHIAALERFNEIAIDERDSLDAEVRDLRSQLATAEGERDAQRQARRVALDANATLAARIESLEAALGRLINNLARFYWLAEEGDLETLRAEMNAAGDGATHILAALSPTEETG